MTVLLNVREHHTAGNTGTPVSFGVMVTTGKSGRFLKGGTDGAPIRYRGNGQPPTTVRRRQDAAAARTRPRPGADTPRFPGVRKGDRTL
jgi:hypothetical protein